MATNEEATQALISEISDKLNGIITDADDITAEIQKTWLNWQGRMLLYRGRSGYHALTKWQSSKKFLAQKQKLLRALEALQKLKDVENTTIKEQLGPLLLKKVLAELKKIELYHLRQIEKVQHIKRPEIHIMKEELHKERRALAKEFKSVRYSTALKALLIPPHDTFVDPHLYNFVKHEEGKTHLRSLIEHSEKIAKIADVVGPSAIVVTPIVEEAAPLASQILTAVPLVGAVVAGIPLVLHSIKTWMQNKSTAKKVGAAIGLGIVATTIITTAVVVATTPIGAAAIATAGAAAFLIGAGGVYEYVMPWGEARKHIKQKKADIQESTNRYKFLEKSYVVHTFSLTHKEKQLLLKAVEKTLLKNPNLYTKLELERANLVLNHVQNTNFLPSIEMIKRSALLSKTLGLTQNDDDRVVSIKTQHFFINEHKKHIDDSNEQLTILRKKAEEKRNMMIAGGLTFAGAALLCVPIPLVQGIGAGLMITGTVIAITVKFKLVSRFKNWINNRSKKEETPKPFITEHDETVENTLRETLSHSSTYTVEKTIEKKVWRGNKSDPLLTTRERKYVPPTPDEVPLKIKVTRPRLRPTGETKEVEEGEGEGVGRRKIR